jgi:hypothetical protein
MCASDSEGHQTVGRGERQAMQLTGVDPPSLRSGRSSHRRRDTSRAVQRPHGYLDVWNRCRGRRRLRDKRFGRVLPRSPFSVEHKLCKSSNRFDYTLVSCDDQRTSSMHPTNSICTAHAALFPSASAASRFARANNPASPSKTKFTITIGQLGCAGRTS